MRYNKNSVLIVDDDPLTLRVLSHILSPDYAVFVVKKGKSAINAIEKYMPDVILLDIVMPDEELGGYDILDAIKKSDRMCNIPIIFITGLNEAEDEAKGLSLGAADYIKKPFSPLLVKLRVQNQIKMLEQYRTIERLTMVDQLTSLPNKRRFNIRLETEWGRAVREQEPISVMLIDIDKFKAYNDSFGQQQGDFAVAEVAGLFPAVLKRSADFAARWESQEFIALLPCTDSKGAFHVAEEIRRAVEALKIEGGPCGDPAAESITVSVGVNTVEYERTREKKIFATEEQRQLYKASMGTYAKEELESVLYKFVSEADKALRVAKDKGRNRTCFLSDAF